MAAKRPSAPPPLYTVRRSPIHGTGVFASRPIRKGSRILEYTGERIDQEEADRRYDDRRGRGPAHVVLFGLDDGRYIDGGTKGGDGRFVNHACAPNCESRQMGQRIFLYALRAIAAGEELTYDYLMDLEGGATSAERKRYACRCGAAACRGTMLAE